MVGMLEMDTRNTSELTVDYISSTGIKFVQRKRKKLKVFKRAWSS
jgi:hypothetical protein